MDKLFNNSTAPNQTNQLQTQIMIERGNPLLEPFCRVKPVVGSDPRTASSGRKTSRSQEIETRSFHEEAAKHDRTEQPVVGRDTNHEPGAPQTRSSDDSKSFNVEDKTAHDRTGTPVVGRDASHEPSNEQPMLNEVNIDFRIPGLPHSVVKQAQNSLVFVNWLRRSRTTLTDMLFN